MNKQEALQAMRDGYKVRHAYYTKDEYVYMDINDHLITEDGCDHGTIYDEFWTIYQNFEDGWEILEKEEELVLNRAAFIRNFPYTEKFINPYNLSYQDSLYRCSPRKVEPVPQRNELCPCNSGLKYKKCCGRL